ncbi:hypothetical protein AMTRI_Chr01g108090 [Amborella trichopoda]
MIMEAVEGKEEEEGMEKGEKYYSSWDCGSPLYDSYELVSLYNLINSRLSLPPSSSELGSLSRRNSEFVLGCKRERLLGSIVLGGLLEKSKSRVRSMVKKRSIMKKKEWLERWACASSIRFWKGRFKVGQNHKSS